MNTDAYRIAPPLIPPPDLSGAVGARLLRLLDVQIQRNLAALDRDRRKRGITDENVIVTDIPYCGHFLGGCAYAFAVWARFADADETTGQMSPERLEQTAVSIIQAWVQAYETDPDKAWRKFASGRFLHLLGMGSWLLEHKLAPETRLRAAQILAAEADRFLDTAAPAQLYDDTQAESNAWTGGGIATVSCMLRHHPHRQLWDEKAKEYMISAYATQEDVESERIVDGKPLNEWLHGPNAFPEYIVENHGFVHPDYMETFAEMVRSAVAYRLAGEPIPEAVAFNADKVFDMLMTLSLPDGTHLYVQGTDYTPRRLDSLFQACNLVPLRPTPRRRAWFLRSLKTLEKMVRERPELPIGGWLGLPYDLGTTWGLAQNYMMARFFGLGGETIPDAELEKEHAGVHISRSGGFALHRTPDTISSVSWHARTDPPKAMGMTMPLDRDVLCYPMPGSIVGEVHEAPDPETEKHGATPAVVHHHIRAREDGFSLTLELTWCSGKVRQNSAFISLPDGRSVYIEERIALEEVALAHAISGNIVLFDDTRWPFQDGPRTYYGIPGRLSPNPTDTMAGNGLSIDDRMGFIVLGSDRFRLYRHEGQPGIWRGGGTMYDTCRIEFLPSGSEHSSAVFHPGARISRFGMISCPNQTRRATAALAAAVRETGWILDAEGALALDVPPFLVYANFSSRDRSVPAEPDPRTLPPNSSGWVPCS